MRWYNFLLGAKMAVTAKVNFEEQIKQLIAVQGDRSYVFSESKLKTLIKEVREAKNKKGHKLSDPLP